MSRAVWHKCFETRHAHAAHWACPTSHYGPHRPVRGARRACRVHRGRLLEGDDDATARGVFDSLSGLAVEAVLLQAATGRPQEGGCGDVWGSTRPTCPTGGRGRGPCGALWRLASCGLCVDEDGRETEARVRVCALTEGLCEPRAAYSSDCSVELPLRPSARAAPPSGPKRLFVRLRAWEQKAGAEYHVNIMSMGMNRGKVCAPGGVLQRVQRQVACETLRESGASSGTEVACHEAASTGMDASVEHSVNGP